MIIFLRNPNFMFVVLTTMLLGLAAYSGIFSHEFVAYDDIRIIINNSDRYDGLNVSNFKHIFVDDFPREEPLLIRDLTYLINAQFFGVANPGGYLIGNYLLHVTCAIFVYLVGTILFPQKPILSFIAAILFVVHPLHTEAVSWISARKEPLYTCFYLASFYFYAKFHLKRDHLYLPLSLILFLLSCIILISIVHCSPL